MRPLAILLFAQTLLIAASAQAQLVAPRCQESNAHIAGGPFTILIGPDVTGRAGFSPAFVVSVDVPAGSPPVNFEQTVKLESKAFSTDLTQKRGEYWLMGHFPRKAVAVAEGNRLAALDGKDSTLYNFYYLVPEQAPEVFFVKVSQAKTSKEALSLPEVEFHRGNGKSGLVMCLRPMTPDPTLERTGLQPAA